MENSDALKKRQYNAIDLIKFICSILVAAIHLEPLKGVFDSNLPNLILTNGIARIAVPFFFMSSGFFLYRKTSFENFSFNYTKKYAAKILKIYVIWSIIYLPLTISSDLKQEKSVISGILEYIKEFIFSGSYAHLWYLRATVVSVLIVSFLLMKKTEPKRIAIVSMLLYAVGLLGQSWFGIISPLKNIEPIWSFLKTIESVILTTRNGIFFGFLFVTLGMMFAQGKIKIQKKTALFGFTVSFILLIAETIFVKEMRLSRASDMLLSLIPTSVFLFSLAVNSNLKDLKIFKTMRKMSTLIFCLHLWVYALLTKLFIVLGITRNSLIIYAITMIICIIISYIIIKLSDIKIFKQLSNLYS